MNTDRSRLFTRIGRKQREWLSISGANHAKIPFVDGEYSPRPQALRRSDNGGIGQTEIESAVLINQLSRAAQVGDREWLQSECAPENIIQEIELCAGAELRDNKIVNFAENRSRN